MRAQSRLTHAGAIPPDPRAGRVASTAPKAARFGVGRPQASGRSYAPMPSPVLNGALPVGPAARLARGGRGRGPRRRPSLLPAPPPNTGAACRCLRGGLRLPDRGRRLRPVRPGRDRRAGPGSVRKPPRTRPTRADGLLPNLPGPRRPPAAAGSSFGGPGRSCAGRRLRRPRPPSRLCTSSRSGGDGHGPEAFREPPRHPRPHPATRAARRPGGRGRARRPPRRRRDGRPGSPSSRRTPGSGGLRRPAAVDGLSRFARAAVRPAPSALGRAPARPPGPGPSCFPRPAPASPQAPCTFPEAW